MAEHECQHANKIDKFTYFMGQTSVALDTMKGDITDVKKDINALFKLNREVLTAVTDLKLETSVETTKLTAKHGLWASLLTLIGAGAGYFFKK